MVMHLGDDVVVHTRDIVAMLDLARADAPDTREFLRAAQETGIVRRITDEPPKTAVLLQTANGRVLYLSPISSATLKRRADFPD